MLLDHGMKVVERVLEKRLCRIVSADEMQCLKEEQLMLYLSLEGCKKSIMLKEKSCILVLWTLRKHLTEFQVRCWSGH